MVWVNCPARTVPADCVMAAAPVSRLFSQPVEPSPVETITPLEEWFSLSLPRLGDGRLVGGVLFLVIGEVATQPADVKLRLHFGGESRFEVRQAGGAHDRDNF